MNRKRKMKNRLGTGRAVPRCPGAVCRFCRLTPAPFSEMDKLETVRSQAGLTMIY